MALNGGGPCVVVFSYRREYSPMTNRPFALTVIFGVTFRLSKLVIMPVQSVHIYLSKRNKGKASKMAASANNL